MKWTSVPLLALLALSGCTALGVPTNIGNGYDISWDRQIYGAIVKIEYRDKAMLMDEVAHRARNRMVEPDFTGVPVGRVFVTYDGVSIEGANTKWLEYVILKDGKEVLRKTGRDQVPDYEVDTYGTSWWSMESLDVPVQPPFELVVISNLKNKRDTFTISPPK